METAIVREARGLGTQIEKALKRAEVRGILRFQKMRGEVITYLPLAKSLGMFASGKELPALLGEIMDDCHEAKEPLLPSLVVGSRTRMPGRGYFDHARWLGYSVGNDEKSEYAFWANQMTMLGLDPSHVGEASFDDEEPVRANEPREHA